MISDQIFYCLQSVHSLLCKWRQLTNWGPDFSGLQKTEQGAAHMNWKSNSQELFPKMLPIISLTLIGAGKREIHLRSGAWNFLSSEDTQQGTNFLSLLFIFFFSERWSGTHWTSYFKPKFSGHYIKLLYAIC